MRAKGDENFIVTGHDAPTRQNAAADMLNQHGVVMGPGIIGPGAEPFFAQRLPRAIAPFRHGKQRVINLPIDERIGVGLPVQWFCDILLGSGIFFETAGPINRIAAAVEFGWQSSFRKRRIHSGLFGHVVSGAFLRHQESVI